RRRLLLTLPHHDTSPHWDSRRPPSTAEACLQARRHVIGRTVTGQRQGRDLVERGLLFLSERFPGAPVRIGAQAYLQRFYEGFGFVAVSDIYDEDGIPHLDMRRG
ncbi:GNAT family N-acetyltransferase, partial [Corallococcus exiguus]|uniref:GNAT family N-acetyltransferase n=1 Tax=Corallococcus exiguus TaxID=83462 RepID=UPI0020B84C6C